MVPIVNYNSLPICAILLYAGIKREHILTLLLCQLMLHKDHISRTLAVASLILGDQGTLCVQTVEYQMSMPIVVNDWDFDIICVFHVFWNFFHNSEIPCEFHGIRLSCADSATEFFVTFFLLSFKLFHESADPGENFLEIFNFTIEMSKDNCCAPSKSTPTFAKSESCEFRILTWLQCTSSVSYTHLTLPTKRIV